MNATKQRDAVSRLAKTDSPRALRGARAIIDPWFRTQALAYVCRYTTGDRLAVANEAEKSAKSCPDRYQQCAVRAWEIAALAESNELTAAHTRLKSVLQQTRQITPNASRSEALSLLLSAAAIWSPAATQRVAESILSVAAVDSHWRCTRAVGDAVAVLCGLDRESATSLVQSIVDKKLKEKCVRIIASGGQAPRPFFW